MFSALQERNFRLFFSGQFVSLMGSWISNTAMSWLVFNLTGSAFLMGAIAFVNIIPTLILTPFAGVVIDKVNQYKMMIFLQTMLMLWAVMLSVLTLLGVVEVWHIVVLGLFSNAVLAFDMPLRQAFVAKLVSKRELLSNAISLNSINFNLAKLIGPAIAGIIIAKSSEGMCFLLNAISFIAVIFALLMMNIKEVESKKNKETKSFIKEMKEGYLYIKNSPIIKTILLFLLLTSFTAGTYSLITPIYVKRLLSGDPKELGYLMSCLGVGSVCGSLYLASRKEKKEFLNQIMIGASLFSVDFILLSFVHVLWFDMVVMFFSGIGLSFVLIGSNSSIQNAVENAKRGRVMSFYAMTFAASIPTGHLIWGYVIEKIGLPRAMFIEGVILLVITMIFVPRFAKVKKLCYIGECVQKKDA